MRQVILNVADFTCSTIQPGSVERLRVEISAEDIVFCQKIEIYNVFISTKNGTLLMEVTPSPYPKMIKPLTFHNLFPPPRHSC